MTDSQVPITNIYYLLCYAWRHVAEQDVIELDELSGLSHVHDLLAKALVMGIFRLLRQGIDRDYDEFEENLAGVRGKINVAETVKQALKAHGQVACEFEELSRDVLHNQILRSTLHALLQLSELNVSIRSDVGRAYTKLAGIRVMRLSRRQFQLVHLDRNRRYYRFLLSICRLIHEQLLVDERSGETRFNSFSDEKMWQLFEDFIIGFYNEEQDNFKVNPLGQNIRWDDAGTPEQYRPLIPNMRADVLLDSSSRRIVIDAKFYKEAMAGQYGPKLRSGHLYQILAYLRNREATKPDGAKHDGILLYPTANKPIYVDVTLEGFRIQARSINLAQDWQDIHRDMLAIIA